MLQNGSVEHSNSPWASLIVLVRKKSGQLRPCVDYRRINHTTHRDSFPLPRIEDGMASLDGAQYFSTLDLTQSYHQVSIAPEDQPKTAVVTLFGRFSIVR